MSKRLAAAAKALGVKKPGSSNDVVQQNKLRQWESLEMELRALKKKFASYRESMQDVMKSGAAVSTGKRGVESGIAFRRHPSYRKAVIEKYGEEAADRIREETPYKPYFYVRLITRNGNGRKGGA